MQDHRSASPDGGVDGDDHSGMGRDRKSFPIHAVVGVIDDPGEALGAVKDLREAGFEPDLLSGEEGPERIQNAGGSPRDVRVIRAVQNLFGYEAEHAERHMKELEAGHFIVLAESRDDETADRIQNVLSNHGGHFVNYYTRWTGRNMVP